MKIKNLWLLVPLIAAITFVIYSYNQKGNIEYPLCGGGYVTAPPVPTGSGIYNGPCISGGAIGYAKDYKLYYSSLVILAIVVVYDLAVLLQSAKIKKPVRKK